MAVTHGTKSIDDVYADIDAKDEINTWASIRDFLRSLIQTQDFGVINGILATKLEIDRACDESARIVAHTAATLTVTQALHASRIVLLDLAAGIIITMPEPTGTGSIYTFIVKTKFTSNTTIVQPDTVNIDLIGGAIIADSAAPTLGEMFIPAATEDLVTLDGTNTGGGLGCWIQYTDLATDLWEVRIVEYVGGTAPATPFTST